MTADKARSSHSRRIVFPVVGVVGLLLIALVAELAVRAWTYAIGGPVVALAKQAPVAGFVFASDDPWQFDPRHGFIGRPGLRYLMGSLTGLSGGCALANSSWPDNNLGSDWDAAELRIGLFGVDDAGIQPDWNRRPWPALLAGELSRLSGRRVAVANYSRPGIGLVQSLVLAADVAPAQRMHLVVLAPTTATSLLDFVYRAMLPIGGATMLVTSSSPRLEEEPTLGVQVGPIINARVTESWCNQLQTATRSGMTGLLRFDRVVNELQAQANVANLLRSKSLVPDWLSMQPALLNLAQLRLPLFTAVREVPRALPSYMANLDLSRDSRATEAINVFRKAGISVHVLQSPLFPELRDRQVLLNYSGASSQQYATLFQSVAALTGHPVLRMLDALQRDIGAEADQIVNNPAGDWTLRVAGTELYASLAARSLLPVISRLHPNKP
jgi:hypothetical protein